MIQAVIGAAIIYYLQLEFWWWIILIIAIILDVSSEHAHNTNSANTIDKLNDIENELVDVKELLDSIESK